jgi:hypothetical protein
LENKTEKGDAQVDFGNGKDNYFLFKFFYYPALEKVRTLNEFLADMLN